MFLVGINCQCGTRLLRSGSPTSVLDYIFKALITVEIGYLGVFRCAEFKSDVCFWFGEIFKSVYCCTETAK